MPLIEKRAPFHMPQAGLEINGGRSASPKDIICPFGPVQTSDY